jgi:hypothetical protein
VVSLDTFLASALLPMEALSTLLARLATDVARPDISPANATSRMSPMASLHLLLLPMLSLPLLFPSRPPTPLLPSFPHLFLLNRSRRSPTMLHDDPWTWCLARLVLLLDDHPSPAFSLLSFWSNILRSSVPVSGFAVFTWHLGPVISFLSSSLSSLLLGADVLSRPTNDLRKVLSRDPDHDVHHFFFSLIPTNDICSRTKAIHSGRREEVKSEQREKREEWIEEHIAERERRDTGRRGFYLVGHNFWFAQWQDNIAYRRIALLLGPTFLMCVKARVTLRR